MANATNFKVGDKVRILDASGITLAMSCGYSDGDTAVLELTRHGELGIPDKEYGGVPLPLLDSELAYIEKVDAKPTKNQRIKTLEETVEQLKARVEQLGALVEANPAPTITVKSEADVSKVADTLAKLHRGETVLPAKTPNQKRKAIIDEAKAFVEDILTEVDQQMGWKTTTIPLYKAKGRLHVNFHVNDKKRTVVALAYYGNLYPQDKQVIGKAIAKCAPDDVFNADIGKAIALGRALGFDVARFEQAAKPTEVVVGQVVGYYGYERLFNVTKNYENANTLSAVFCEMNRENVTIIDDTEAQY